MSRVSQTQLCAVLKRRHHSGPNLAARTKLAGSAGTFTFISDVKSHLNLEVHVFSDHTKQQNKKQCLDVHIKRGELKLKWFYIYLEVRIALSYKARFVTLLLENWGKHENDCWNGDILKKLSLHVEYILRLPRKPGVSVLKLKRRNLHHGMMMRWRERTEEHPSDCHIQFELLKRPWKFNWNKSSSLFSAVIMICKSTDAKVDNAVIRISQYYRGMLVNHCPLIFVCLFSLVDAMNSYRGFVLMKRATVK